MAHDLYISVDVEADGRVPVDGSMVQVGACVAATLRGRVFTPANQGAPTGFKREIQQAEGFDSDPETVRWLGGHGVPVNGPDAIPPRLAMEHFREWVLRVSGDARPVFVAYPLSYDWTFVHFYFEHFLGPKLDPFGFSSALDIKSMYAAKAGVPLSKATKGKMPNHLTAVSRKHTHDALDDAVGQAELFCNVWQWAGPDSEEETK